MGFLQNKPIAHVVVAVLLLLISVQTLPDSIDSSEIIERMTENGMVREQISADEKALPTTSMLLSAEKDDWVSDTQNLKLGENTYYEIDDLTYNLLDSFPAHSSSTFRMLSSRSTFSHDGIYLIAYIVTNNSQSKTYDFILSGSTDRGSTWDHDLVMTGVDINEPRVELSVHEDKLFFVTSMSPDSLTNVVDIFALVTPFANWRNLSTVEPERFVINGDEAFTQLLGIDGKMFLFVKNEGYSRPDYHIYDNGTWLPVRTMPGPTLSFSVVTLMEENIQQVYFLFLDGSTPKSIREVHSADAGGTWSNSEVFLSGPNTIKYLVATSDENRIHGAVTFSDSTDVGQFIYDGSTMSVFSYFFTHGSNSRDTDDFEMTIGMKNDDIMVAWEDEDGTITVARSFDSGISFHGVGYGSGLAHSPSIAGDLSLFIFMNGGDLQVADMRNAGTGSLVTGLISAPGVSSWDQLALSLGGASNEGSFEFLIRSEMGDQIFPSIPGMISVHSFSSDMMGGHHFQHVIDISGMIGVGTHDRISLEFRFSSLAGERPTLFSMLLNFTVTYPYEMKIIDDIDMVGMFNVRVSPVGLELENVPFTGYAVIGPFMIEDSMPHHLWARGTFLNIEDTCTFSILTSNHTDRRSFEGFDTDLSDELVTSDEFVPIKWGRSNLYDLPPSTTEFYIKVDIKRTGSLSPRLTSLRLGYTSQPVIEDVRIDQTEIFRELSTVVHIQAYDPEEPVDHLYPNVMMMEPNSNIWSDTGISDPLWNGEDWEVTVSTNILTRPGNYSFKINLSDGIGYFGDEVVVSNLLSILNNVPTPPFAAVEPSLPVTGDTLTIKMISPGLDVETETSLLTYNIYLYKEGDLYSKMDNLTYIDQGSNDPSEFILDDPVLLKDERWDILITTYDGIEESPPFRLLVTVLNTQPEVIWDGNPIEIFEDEVDVALDPADWFRDMDGDDLEITVNGPEEISPKIEDGMIVLILQEDFHGSSWLWVNAFDGVRNVSINISLDIEEVNDLPLWNRFDTLTVREGDWLFADIGATDPHDGELPLISINDFVPGLIDGQNILYYHNGSFRFHPDNSMVGTHRVLFSVKDRDTIISDSFNITVVNTNQPPQRPEVTPEGDIHVYQNDEQVRLNAVSNDLDLIWGDALTYLWESSIDGEIGQGSEITPSLSVGVHIITVTVMDGEGETNSTSITIEILDKEMRDGIVMRTWMVYGLSCVLPLILSLILGFIIIMVTRRKKEKDDEEGEKEEGSGSPTEGPGVESKDGPSLPSAPKNELAGVRQPERVLPPHVSTPSDTPPVPEQRSEPQPPEIPGSHPQPETTVQVDDGASIPTMTAPTGPPPPSPEQIPDNTPAMVEQTQPPEPARVDPVQQGGAVPPSPPPREDRGDSI